MREGVPARSILGISVAPAAATPSLLLHLAAVAGTHSLKILHIAASYLRISEPEHLPLSGFSAASGIKLRLHSSRNAVPCYALPTAVDFCAVRSRTHVEYAYTSISPAKSSSLTLTYTFHLWPSLPFARYTRTTLSYEDMRLLNTTTYRLEEFDSKTPKYAILSHRWGDEEMTYQDFYKQRNRNKSGYHKIIQACDFARKRSQQWLWIDTCCIDKKSSAELSEAINSMFDWYQEAEECYVYLVDVRPPSKHSFDAVEKEFYASDWFNRGWTLQELLAPSQVMFCTDNWEIMGTKESNPEHPVREFSHRAHLNSMIADITGIPEDVLCNPNLIRRRSVAQRMSWASQRQTTRIEDQAYCLLGLFGVNIPLLYGERSKAFIRLQQEILLTSLDESLLAWTADPESSSCLSGVLATSPAAFSRANNIEGSNFISSPRFKLAGGGLVEFRPDDCSEMAKLNSHTSFVTLRCISNPHAATFCANDDCFHPNFTLVMSMRPCGHYERVHSDTTSSLAGLLFEKIVPGIMYMHASPTSRCAHLADFVPAQGNT